MKVRTMRIIISLSLFVCLMPRPLAAQASSTVVRIGEWLVSELGSYALGKVLDKSIEYQNYSDLYNQRKALQQRGANDNDPQLTSAELRSVNSEMRILHRLISNRVSVGQIDELKAEIATNNQRLLAALANHEERIQRLELLNKITGSWECAGQHRWLKILPDGTVFCCYIGSLLNASTGEITSNGVVNWQSADCNGKTGETTIEWRVSRDGANLIIWKGDRKLLCARANPAIPDSCNAPF